MTEKIVGARQDLLQGDVGDGVFDDEARARLAFGDFAPGARRRAVRRRTRREPSRSPSRETRLR